MNANQPDAPGLKWRARKNGRAAYWVARADLVLKGFRPETVRIHFDPADPNHMMVIAGRCMMLQAEMLSWSAGHRERREAYDGTLGSLIREYQTSEDSPYRDLRPNTRTFYDYGLELLEANVGNRHIRGIDGADVRRWYRAFRQPRPLTEEQIAAGKKLGPERVRRAYAAIQMLRVVVGFGVSLVRPECVSLDEAMRKMEFEGVRTRETRMTHEQVTAFRKAAHDLGRPSMALGVILQFDLGMRQRDVIGEWRRLESPSEDGITDGLWRWSDGLAWSHISGTILRKRTSKTGKDVEHDLANLPDAAAELGLVPAARRIGPLILNEETGRPYKRRIYAKWFRKIAREAGIPDDVWSMDARAGAVTEALDAGAVPLDVMTAAGHTQLSTTQRYDRTTLQKTARVAQLRVASRQNKD
ncbi:tyrosine-type recombinase/integrase [Xanthobacter sediminis]